MSLSTFQKVTLVSCFVLCISLLLPKILLSRSKKEVGQPEAGQGRFSPMMHRQKTSESQSQWVSGSHFPKAPHTEPIAKAKGNGAGGSGGGRSSFMGQIIPIYGFGIFLYILYILFKITSKGKNTQPDHRFPALKTENMKRKITDFELAQLQEKLKETEEVMERIVSKVGHNPEGIKSVTSEHEEKLLHQLKEITRVMQEGRLIEGISPEEEAEDVPYNEDWEGYPEETYPIYEEPASRRQTYDTIVLDRLDTDCPTPEEVAERMGDTEDLESEECYSLGPLGENDMERKGEEHRGKQTTFCEPRDMFQYQEDDEEEGAGGEEEEEEEEEDPAVVAENLGFSCEHFSDPEDEGEDSCQIAGTAVGSREAGIADEPAFGVLRKRNK
ncbi:protein RIC-3 isoform X1 [Amia ocellicauda]|uniref:protein RIC-3 isoform X1 n=1 Tax=Amia ocellicauda TaxID=2972642 RepID=UPI003464D4F1